MVYQNMTAGQFAAEIGVQNSTLSHILNNRNNPSLDVLKKILSRFPEISADWLILGQGSMFRQEIQSKELTLFDSVDESNSLSVHLNTPDMNILPKDANVNQNEMLKNPLNSGFGQQKQEMAHRTGKIAASVIISEEENQSISPQQAVNNKAAQAGFHPMTQRTATRVIIYFSDNTFQEFESK